MTCPGIQDSVCISRTQVTNRESVCQHLVSTYSLTSYTADLALQRLTLGNVIDYSLGVAPLTAGFLILPSLAGAAGREPAEAWELSLSLPTYMCVCVCVTRQLTEEAVPAV